MEVAPLSPASGDRFDQSGPSHAASSRACETIRPMRCASTAISWGMMNTGVAWGLFAAGARSGLEATTGPARLRLGSGAGSGSAPFAADGSLGAVLGRGDLDEACRSFSFWRSR